MKYISVTMIRSNMDELPACPLPEGYRVRNFESGDEHNWANIEAAAGEFNGDKQMALQRFQREFMPHPRELERRCLFLVGAGGRAIGTATAWYNDDFKGGSYGRLHFVAIHPEYQGRGLGKALVGAACRKMAGWHTKAYLTSQTTSYIAINIYLGYAFEPCLVGDQCREGWGLLAKKLRHPCLGEFLA